MPHPINLFRCILRDLAITTTSLWMANCSNKNSTTANSNKAPTNSDFQIQLNSNKKPLPSSNTCGRILTDFGTWFDDYTKQCCYYNCSGRNLVEGSQDFWCKLKAVELHLKAYKLSKAGPPIAHSIPEIIALSVYVYQYPNIYNYIIHISDPNPSHIQTKFHQGSLSSTSFSKMHVGNLVLRS